MNATEAFTLVRMVRAICPSQKLDEFSPDAWAVVLSDIRFQEAHEAVANLGRTNHFIDPVDIRTEVKRVRTRRIEAHGYPVPPAGLTTAKTITWLREAWQQIGDGETIQDDTRGKLKPRNMPQLVTRSLNGRQPWLPDDLEQDRINREAQQKESKE